MNFPQLGSLGYVTDFASKYDHKPSHTATSSFCDQSNIAIAVVSFFVKNDADTGWKKISHCWRLFTSAENNVCVDAELTEKMTVHYRKTGVLAPNGTMFKHSDGCAVSGYFSSFFPFLAPSLFLFFFASFV